MRTKKRERRGAENGAVMVEAIVVISVFILLLTGLAYFHNLYLSKLRTSRIGRAATLRHAIVGCQGDIAHELAAAGGSAASPGGHTSNDVPYGEAGGSKGGLSSVA